MWYLMTSILTRKLLTSDVDEENIDQKIADLTDVDEDDYDNYNSVIIID